MWHWSSDIILTTHEECTDTGIKPDTTKYQVSSIKYHNTTKFKYLYLDSKTNAEVAT